MLVNIGVVIAVWVGGRHVIEGGMTIGQIVAFVNYLLTTMGPLTMMTMLANVWANGIASAQRINEVLDAEARSAGSPEALPLAGKVQGRVDLPQCYLPLQRQERL
jgi:ATP-binding cassette, subfamily B, multidrug efflux pump